MLYDSCDRFNNPENTHDVIRSALTVLTDMKGMTANYKSTAEELCKSANEVSTLLSELLDEAMTKSNAVESIDAIIQQIKTALHSLDAMICSDMMTPSSAEGIQDTPVNCAAPVAAVAQDETDVAKILMYVAITLGTAILLGTAFNYRNVIGSGITYAAGSVKNGISAGYNMFARSFLGATSPAYQIVEANDSVELTIAGPSA